MRAWLYDLLSGDAQLQGLVNATPEEWADRVMPRQSQTTFNIDKPFLVFGMGNNTNEALAEDQDHTAHRQFFSIWVHDEGGDYDLIERILIRVKQLLVNASHPASHVSTVMWLETSQEFVNDTYNTIFKYARFQAIISNGVGVVS